MVRRHRTRVGILLDILRSINELGDASITEIITHANIPHDRLQKILNKLVKKRLVIRKIRKNRVTFILSPKGFDLMRELERLKSLLEGLGLEV